MLFNSGPGSHTGRPSADALPAGVLQVPRVQFHRGYTLAFLGPFLLPPTSPASHPSNSWVLLHRGYILAATVVASASAAPAPAASAAAACATVAAAVAVAAIIC